jgi:hypothetical protein
MLERNLHHGDYIPAGWKPLFARLISELNKLDPTLEVVQAKQKFGELRVYLRSCCPRAADLIDAATRESKKTCETCGAEATLRAANEVYRTLCEDHRGGSSPAKKSPIIAHYRLSQRGLKSVE